MASTDFDIVNIQGTEYKIPRADANPPYGEEFNDFLNALVNAINTLVGPADIKESAQTILNNQSSPINITLLNFDSSIVGSITVNYRVYRSTDTNHVSEAGDITFVYDPAASVGLKWSKQREFSRVYSGVDFFIADNGQVSYTSSNITGANYSGLIKFKANAILQVA